MVDMTGEKQLEAPLPRLDPTKKRWTAQEVGVSAVLTAVILGLGLDFEFYSLIVPSSVAVILLAFAFFSRHGSSTDQEGPQKALTIGLQRDPGTDQP